MGAYDDIAAQEASLRSTTPLPVTDGTYDTLALTEAETKQRTLKASLNVATQTDPVKAGTLQVLADKTGLPAPVIERNTDQVAQQQRARELYQAVQDSPILARQMSDPAFAKIAQDDTPSLGIIERTFKTYLGASVKSGTEALIGVGAKMLDTFNPFTLSEQDAAVLYKNEPEKLAKMQTEGSAMFLSRFTRAMQQASQNTMAAVNPEAAVDYSRLKYATTKPSEAAYLSPIRVVGDALQSLPTSLALGVSAYLTKGVATRVEAQALAEGMTAEAARTVAVRAASETMARLSASTEGAAGYAQQAMQTREQADQVSDATLQTSPEYQALIAKGYSPEAARVQVSALAAETAGVTGGAVDAIVNFFGGGILGRVIGEGGKLFTRTAKGAATEALTEAVQSGGEQIGQNEAVQRFLDPNQELLDGVAESMAQGFTVGGFTGGAFSATFGRNRQAEQAGTDVDALKQLLAAAGESKLRERSPQTFTQFVNNAATDGPVEAVYVNAAQFQQGAVEAGIDIAKAMPETAAAIADAVATGTDVRIPLGEFAAVIPGTTLEQSILPHLRTSPDGPTHAEATDAAWVEDTRKQTEKILEEHGFTDVWKQSVDAVKTELLTQLKTANRFTPAVNDAYAGFMSAFYATQAHRLGVTPEQMYVKYPLRIQASGLVGDRTLDQGRVAPRIEIDQEGELTADQILTSQKAFDGAAANVKERKGSKTKGPLEVWRTEDGRYLLVDGQHRFAAGVGKGQSKFKVKVIGEGYTDYYATPRTGEEFKSPQANVLEQGAAARELVIQHNLTAENLLHAVRMGGIPVPSLAITKAADTMVNFGEITLLGDKKLADPKGYAKPKVFGADVYSPRYPDVEFKFSSTALKKLNAALAPYREEGVREVYSGGIRKVDDLTGDKAFRKYAEEKLGKDFINSSFSELQPLAEELIRDAGAEERIFQGYTENGRRYKAHTLDNVVKILKKELRGGESDSNIYGVGQLRSKFTPQFRSVEQIKKSKDKLVSKTDFEKIKDEVDAEFFKIVEQVAPFYKHDAERFGFADTVIGTLADSATMGLSRAARENEFNDLDDDAKEAIYKFVERLRNLPTEYFEAKVLREVSLAEFNAAVVPDDTKPEVIAVLERSGIEVAQYKKHDDADRKQVVNALATKLGESVLFQNSQGGARGNITFGDNLQQPSVITLLQNADLTTFLHESGHFYLEVLTDMAQQPDAPAEIVADLNAVLKWFGVAPDIWPTLSIDEKRPYHEQFARGFEAYLFEGKAPSTEVSSLFGRFRAWMVNVYKQLQALNVTLNDDVRAVFDRLLATNDEIIAAETARNMLPIFENRPAGMSEAEWKDYQALGADATQDAVDQLQTRSLRDMKWLSNAKAKVLRDLQRQAKDIRRGVRIDARREILSEPIYQAWQYLAGKLELSDKPKVAPSTEIDPKRDSLFTAIAKAGGLDRAEVLQRWGVDIADAKGMKAETIDTENEPAGKLDTSVLKGRYGAEDTAAWRKLTNLGMTSVENGLHPDTVAELFGFSSGDELVQKLLSAEPPRLAIEGLTDQRMLEEHGDLTDPRSMGKAADAAVHNDARARFVATELRALSNAVNVREDTGRVNAKGRKISIALLPQAAREFAAGLIARKKIKDIKPSQFTAAEARAAKAAERALMADDIEVAAMQKRNQLVNLYAAKAAHDAVDEVDKGVAYLKRVGESKTIDFEYRDQINALLERFDLRAVSNKDAARRSSLAQWVETQTEKGLEPVISENLLNEANRQPYREMPLEEFRGLLEAVRNIEHLGRLKHKLLTAKDAREFAAVVEDLKTSITDNAKRTLVEKLERNTWTDKVGEGAAEFFALHRKFSMIARELDGHKDNGVFWNRLVRPMNEAGDAEAVLREQATIKLQELFEPILKAGRMTEKLFIPEINGSLSREGRIMVALNMGNEGNLQRLIDGERGWTIHSAQAVLDTLTKAEMDFVQAVWNYVGSYRQQIGDQQKRLTGIEPEWVEPRKVITPHGEYAGGYLPVKYDTTRSTRALADEAVAGIMDMWRGKRGVSKARDSFTKGRADKVVNRPVRKDFGVVTQHITEVTHRLAWQDYLTDATRLLRAPAIDGAIRDHYGPAVLKALRDTIEDVAAGDVPATNVIEKGLNYARTGATIAGLAWRFTTMMLQPIGLTQSMVRIGPKYVGRGLAEWLGDAAKMENTAKRIYEKSSMMRLRGKTMQREISEIRNQIKGNSSTIEATYFYGIQKLQLVADIPTWLGQYHKAVEHGADEAGAVAQADQAVLDAQGGGTIKDLAGVQRGSGTGGAALKLFTNFYSFFNTTYNLTGDAIGRTNFKKPGEIGLLAVDFLLLYTVPAVLGTLMKAALKSGDDDDDKSLWRQIASDQLTFMLGTMIGVRELSGGIQTMLGLPGDYQGPASLRLFSEVSKFGKQVGQVFENGTEGFDESFWKSLNNLGGVLFHYPSGQINATADGIVTMAQGKTDNPGALLVGSNKK